MLINIKTNVGYAFINTDSIDGMYFNLSGEKLYVYRKGQANPLDYNISESKIKEAVEKINKLIIKEGTNID